MASLEGLCKKFPENYAVWEIPGVPLKINGEDWVLEWHPGPGLADNYFLTRGTPESIREARRIDWLNTSLTYKDRYVHLRVDGSLSSVPSVQLVPVTMPLKDMAKAIRKIKE